MVYYRTGALDRTFAALSDPTRRALLARLSQTDNLSVSQLAEPFAMSLPAVMKHLDVLSDAGLVTRSKSGRTVACRLRAEPMHEANEWLKHYQRFWTDRLDQLAAYAGCALLFLLALRNALELRSLQMHALRFDPQNFVSGNRRGRQHQG